MAKNNDKRAERMARSNRNVNRAITVLMAGVIAEFYLLMVNNYYVKGGVGQVLTMMTVLQVIDYIGCALFGAGLVVWLMRKKWTRFAPAAPWLLCIGFFFAVSSILMLKVYPQGTTMMCVIVPVVMLIGIVFLLYFRAGRGPDGVADGDVPHPPRQRERHVGRHRHRMQHPRDLRGRGAWCRCFQGGQERRQA